MNKKGFTLVETLVYIGLIAIIIASVAVFLTKLGQVRIKTLVISEVEMNARLVFDRLVEAARHAEAINIGASTFDSDPGVISFDMVDAGEDPTIFSLTADNGNFQVNIAGAGNTPITTDSVSISNLVFTNLTSSEDLGIIQVSYTVETLNTTDDPYFDYAETFQTTLRIPLD
ncbi:MAG: type II secretion system protein [bacterium]